MVRGRSLYGVLSSVQKAVVSLVALVALLIRSPAAVNADSLCEAFIFPLGYTCDEYTVETPDGFLLGMYNIPYGRAGPGSTQGQPVLLFHGFQAVDILMFTDEAGVPTDAWPESCRTLLVRNAGGDNYVSNSPEESLGTVLADAGYDVWIGNNRNIRWSNGNVKYGYNDSAYWDWTWDELAAYDIPSSIEFVYNQRGGTKIFYVAHSQGTMTFFASLSGDDGLRNQVSSQVRAAVLLAPFAYNSHITAPLNNLLLSNFVDVILPIMGVGPMDVTMAVQMVCNGSEANCKDLLDGMLGPQTYINQTRLPLYLENFPQLTSSYNFNHFGQTKRSGLFQKYDKGPILNLFSYGQFSPPLYDLSTFPSNIPLQIFMGGRDGLADPVDVEHTLSSLPSSVSQEVQNFPDYGHLDFVMGERAYLDIYPILISFLQGH